LSFQISNSGFQIEETLVISMSYGICDEKFVSSAVPEILDVWNLESEIRNLKFEIVNEYLFSL
jgi:hypothetical protein